MEFQSTTQGELELSNSEPNTREGTEAVASSKSDLKNDTQSETELAVGSNKKPERRRGSAERSLKGASVINDAFLVDSLPRLPREICGGESVQSPKQGRLKQMKWKQMARRRPDISVVSNSFGDYGKCEPIRCIPKRARSQECSTLSWSPPRNATDAVLKMPPSSAHVVRNDLQVSSSSPTVCPSPAISACCEPLPAQCNELLATNSTSLVPSEQAIVHSPLDPKVVNHDAANHVDPNHILDALSAPEFDNPQDKTESLGMLHEKKRDSGLTLQQNMSLHKRRLQQLWTEVNARLRLWVRESTLVQEADGEGKDKTNKMRLIMSEEQRDVFVKNMIESCQKDPQMRASFLGIVTQLVNHGVLHSSAPLLLDQVALVCT